MHWAADFENEPVGGKEVKSWGSIPKEENLGQNVRNQKKRNK